MLTGHTIVLLVGLNVLWSVWDKVIVGTADCQLRDAIMVTLAIASRVVAGPVAKEL